MSWQELPLDRIYFDSVTGVPGTTWPIGTPTVPSDVIADVILMCAARNLKVIDVHGAVVLGAAMAHYDFIGHRHEDVTDTLDLNGQDVDSSIISRCIVAGAQGATGLLTLRDCLVYLLTNFQGIANYCDLYGSAMSLRDASVADFHHCNSVHSDLTITVQAPTRASFKEMAGNCTFTAQDGGVLYIRGFKGSLVIDAMTGGTCDIYANGADITINANCDAPSVISIYGNARVTIVGAPTATINDYTINMIPAADAATNVQMRDVLGNKEDTPLTAPTAADSIMRYIKGILSSVAGTTGSTMAGKAQIAATTIDLDLGIGSHDLFTGTAQAVILESLNIKLPTGAPGGTLTSISIETDDATPGVIIDAVAGAVANLLTEADLGWTGTLYITVGTKIQLSILGGPSVADYICQVTTKCRAVVAGGYLAP